MVSHDGDQDASVSGAHDDHDDDDEEIRPGKESEMRQCLAALAAVSWSRQASPTPLCHPAPVSLHTCHLESGKLFSEHNQSFE